MTTDALEERIRLCDMLERVAAEDRDALGELYRMTSAKLFGICLRICGDRSSAEDVLHDVYAIIWKRAGAFQVGSIYPVAWLATIARNRSIDWVRSHGRRPMRPIEEAFDIADDTQDQAVTAERAETVQRLYDCLNELTHAQRDAIRTAFVDGMTYAEIADARGVPLGTMKSWVRRGLLQLRGCVGDD
ncbi:sigma-70 family RNA polymerase sigma factor [Sphingomonas sp. Leaf62]|uniref:sigma-70 family RNA polymerase sigma factor n=1 Tax=Sphingomonas sp. Leaf62 TaxID=1736228 RepID=UPI000ADCA55F|nr:sigma-70 family RNA polymerase sigma factor [Sphingomonas sp. Leaf62]